MTKRIFIGVAWPYVNGHLHVGHMGGYLIPADICARYHRLRGHQVLMVSGSDCHGTPITVEADRRQISPAEVVALYHPQHQKLFRLYGISFDLYTKTTTRNHRQVAQQMLLDLAKNGYLLRQESQQYYSPSQKRFLPDRYVEGTCPYCGYAHARGDQCDQCGRVLSEGELLHPKSKLDHQPVVLRPSEHLYLNLPKFAPFLHRYVSRHGPHWRPWIYQETKGWLQRGLQPRSITRDLDWGIPIPNDQLPAKLRLKNPKHKRLYVWFEAVIGYLSASIEWAHKKGQPKLWQDFWQGEKDLVHYYFMGKDNLVFHTLFWPAQLHGSNPQLHLPDFPVINHFLNFEGQQFSKSRGITVDAAQAAHDYGADALRFYLTYIAPETSDSTFSWPDFFAVHNNILIGTLANFINRSLHLAQKAKTWPAPDSQRQKQIQKLINQAQKQLENCSPRQYLQAVLQLATQGNQYLNQEEPWHQPAASRQFSQTIGNTLAFVLAIQLLLMPLLPTTSQKLAKMTGVNFSHWPDHIPLKKVFSKIRLGKIQPLFKKLDANKD